ncbi:hypothetical protein HYPSUDRAFT_458445 [Hypholoma sublateritium FD-334 SS-4]|uniref:Uncharacterized protein n=1 Tax=Hypholoma sublateritium (strain FD-334 SS-4) TaxID=945553 RepID=A0A0D2KI52_HYPSF|nr:hypothetical protein HYPSUDRAFT_458445 [Hypholoma sublateritium FD-334 SS-4]
MRCLLRAGIRASLLALLDSPSNIGTGITQLLRGRPCFHVHRTALSCWTPFPVSSERASRSRRGWEKTVARARRFQMAGWSVGFLREEYHDARRCSVYARRPRS